MKSAHSHWNAILPPRPLDFQVNSVIFWFFFVVTATTVVEISNLGTVKWRLFQWFVHFVMYMASPGCGCGTRCNLRWKSGKNLLEVTSAFATSFFSNRKPRRIAQWGQYHGYKRAKRCRYEVRADFSSALGLSGNFAIVVWSTFQAALPSSALAKMSEEGWQNLWSAYFNVSFPIFPAITSPFKTAVS